MATIDNPYILMEEDLEYYGTEDRPEIRAARNPDPRVLIALLDNAPAKSRRNYTAGAFVPGHTNRSLEAPLLAAVKAQLPENVRTLLTRGADPNEIPVSGLSAYAGYFLRFRDHTSLIAAPREEVIKAISIPQTVPMTVAEIEARSTRLCHFWSSVDSVPLNHYRGGDGATALEEASKHDSIEILEMVLSSSPDISFWTTSESHKIPDPVTPSSLSVSNPMLCAIKNGHANHLQKLLNLGLNPNSMPLACCQQAYSPTMATLMFSDPPNWDALSLLLANPKIELNLVTPLTKVHFLHIAVALLSLPLLKRVLDLGFSLSTAEPTALGHTLLHIACLPLDITHVNIFQESIYSSAHEFRQLSPSRMRYHIHFDIDSPQPQPTDFFADQAELVHYLLSQSPDPDALIAAQDFHGNTALHYLAMHRTVNQELLDDLLDDSEKAQDVYYDVRNRWGWTAENLVRHGEVAEVDDSKSFWVMSHAARITEGGVVIPY